MAETTPLTTQQVKKMIDDSTPPLLSDKLKEPVDKMAADSGYTILNLCYADGSAVQEIGESDVLRGIAKTPSPKPLPKNS